MRRPAVFAFLLSSFLLLRCMLCVRLTVVRVNGLVCSCLVSGGPRLVSMLFTVRTTKGTLDIDHEYGRRGETAVERSEGRRGRRSRRLITRTRNHNFESVATSIRLTSSSSERQLARMDRIECVHESAECVLYSVCAFISCCLAVDELMIASSGQIRSAAILSLSLSLSPATDCAHAWSRPIVCSCLCVSHSHRVCESLLLLLLRGRGGEEEWAGEVRRESGGETREREREEKAQSVE